MTHTQDLRAFCKKINDKFVGNFSDNPGAPGGGHAEHEGPGYQQGGGRGFGYNRGGFRGRGRKHYFVDFGSLLVDRKVLFRVS